jgi:hypothetical protein
MSTRLIALALVLGVMRPIAAQAACGACKAEQVTSATASTLLFGGPDASGGIDDWYLTNGKVQAIIDDIGPAETGVTGVTVDKTSSNAVETGGTLVDVGLSKKNNDQLPQSFNVGGLSLANVFLFRQGDQNNWPDAAGATNPCPSTNPACPTDPDCAAITVYGIMLGACNSPTAICSTRTNPKMFVRTTYKACNGRTVIEMRTEVWNKSGNQQALPIFDVFLWGGRGVTAFAPDKGRGFSSPVLDLSSTTAILSAFTFTPFFAAPGNLSKTDGIISRGKTTNAISYGYYSQGVDIDSNGGDAGGTITDDLIKPFTLTSLQSGLISAVTPSLGILVGNNQSAIYDRTLVVAARNDVAAALGDAKNAESVLNKTTLPKGTISGKVTGSKQEGTITFIRTGGDDLSSSGAGFAALNSAVMSQVRTKSSFKDVVLPAGTYVLRAVFPGHDDVISSEVTVTNGGKVVAPTIVLPSNGTLQIDVRDADTLKGIPAKVSLSPSPSMGRDFASFTFDTRTGKCSNSFTTTCVLNSDCGAGNICFRTCTNVAPQPCGTGCPDGFICGSDNRCHNHGCNSDADCDADALCKADTSNNFPESFPGTVAQLNVLYTDAKGKIKAEVRPGTYTVTVSRGLEYTIEKLDNVVIASKSTTKGGPVLLKRVVDTTGYMSADFHIHSARSLDSAAPLEARVRSFAGEGLEVMVSTDHDINTDFLPAIQKMKLQSFITSIIGTEVTTSVPRPPYLANAWGHFNGWPTIFDPDQRRSGSVEDESVSLNVILDRLRANSNVICIGGKENGRPCPPSACPKGACTDVGEQVVQLNHPRAGVSGVVNIGMFNNIGYDPSKSITSCSKYPVLCNSSECAGGTNDGTSCTSDAQCTGGGKCGCGSAGIPPAANGCNDILRDRNVVPQPTRCTSAGCGSGFENPNGTRNVDVDIMEIDNGGSTGSFGGLRRVRRDWLSLLNQGVMVGKPGSQHPLWGTGVSDSHRIVAELPGYSRTFVGAGDLGTTGSIDIKGFNEQVVAGNMMATAGPYIEFTMDQGGTPVKMGETLSGTGSVNLNITVQAAPWVPVDEVRIVKNGCVLQCYNTTTTPAVSANPSDPYGDTGVVRFDATVVDTASGDSYYIVEASPNLPAPGSSPTVDPVVNSVAENNFPFGFTNPIFVDTNGGGYTGITLAAGSGEPTCPALPASCSAGSATAYAAPATMYAAASSAAPRGLLARLFGLLASPAAAAHDDGPEPENEDERIRQHEEKIRKSSGEYYPWRLLELPTPRPEDVRSVPSTEPGK